MEEKILSEAPIEELKEVSDDMLDSALAAEGEPTKEEKKEEVKEVEKEVEDKEVEEVEEKVPDVENAEKSKLGRKVAAMERNFNMFMEEMRQFATATAPKKAEVEEDDDTPLTKKDVERYLEERSTKKALEEKAYSNKYITKMVTLTEELDETVLDEVLTEVDSKYNKKRTGNPDMDAQLDYLEAYNGILARKSGKKSNPLEKNKDKKVKGLGISGEEKNSVSSKKEIALDHEAAAFAKQMGLSPEEIEDALSNESPTLVITGSGFGR